MTGGLQFVIGAKDMATGVLNKIKSAVRDTMVVAGGNLLAKGLTSAFNGMRSLVDMAMEAEEANVKLDAALRGLGMYSPELSAQMRDLASAIQNETGVSDEATKANIAHLLTLGVMPEKVGVAARAVQALTAINKDGQSAMVAVAKALDGDTTGFEKVSSAVRNATTVHDKFVAIQQLINAGYEQQRANLLTVAGSWGALKERIGDAVEDMGMAIMKGAGLGETFNSLQEGVGRFLQGQSWQTFLTSLESGAKYAKDIAVALTKQGGFTESLKSVADLIISAFVDGAKKAKEEMMKSVKGSVFGDALSAIGGILESPFVAIKSLSGVLGRASVGDFSDGKPANGSSSDQSGQSSIEKSLGRIFAKADANTKERTREEIDAENDRNFAALVEKRTSEKKLKLALEEGERIAKMKDLSEKVSKAWEAKYAAEKQDYQAQRKQQAEAAKAKYEQLFAEYMDPSKRQGRMDAERQKAEAEAQLQREYADIERKQGTTFGLRNPTEREKQVMELMQAKNEAKVSQDQVQRDIEKNTRDLADKLDNLLKVRG